MAVKKPAKPTWEDRAKRFLKAELARAEIGYRELAERLKPHGFEETESSIANKLSRGTFPATFFLAAPIAMGVRSGQARGCLGRWWQPKLALPTTRPTARAITILFHWILFASHDSPIPSQIGTLAVRRG